MISIGLRATGAGVDTRPTKKAAVAATMHPPVNRA